MILDGLLTFTGTSNGATGTIANGAQTDAPTTGTQDASNIIDLGVVGLPPFASGGGARDIGVGDAPSLKLSAIVTTAFASGTSLQIELQGAPDNGSGAPGGYTAMFLGPTLAEVNLIQGAQLANADVPRVIFEQVVPRFLKMTFISVGTHTTGAVEAQIVIDRFDQIIGAAGDLSGYPAGVVVVN
ncbi:MAG: hypothetical protein ACREHG_08955 [Candidatus Saccharimonadales bacterium]